MKIGVLGSGSWGMTLAIHLLKNGHEVSVWFYLKQDYDKALMERELPDYLPDVKLPAALNFTMDMGECVSDKEIILVAIPSHTVGATLSNIADIIPSDARIVNVAKGIENDLYMVLTTEPGITLHSERHYVIRMAVITENAKVYGILCRSNPDFRTFTWSFTLIRFNHL